MTAALLPEVREAEASPEIRAIYDDICNVMRVPFVNLIHRYLATIPSALAYAWSLGREACIDGRLDRSVATMVADAKLDEIRTASGPPLPEAAQIVEIYNRQNPRNVIIFNALLTVLRDRNLQPSDDAPPQFAAAKRTVPATAIPSLPKFADLDPEDQRMVSELTALQNLAGRGLVPSLFLHLSAVPTALLATYDTILQPLRDGVIAERVERVRAGAGVAARQLVPLRLNVPKTVYERRAEIADVVASFTERAIPSMVVIGNVLSRRFGEAPDVN